MGNKLNPFEEQIKRAANNFEAPYSPSAWDKVNDGLNQGVPSGTSAYKWGLSAIAIAVVVLGSYMYLSNTSPVKEELAQENPTEEPVVDNSQIINEPTKELTESSNEVPTSDIYEIRDVYLEEKVDSPQKEDSLKNQETTIDKSKPEEKVVKENTIKDPSSKETKQEVAVNTFKMPSIVIANKIACIYTEVALSLSESIDNELLWDMGNGEFVQGNNVRYEYPEAGVYTIQAMLLNDKSQKTNQVDITVNPKPDASFSVMENLERGAIPVVYFSANHGGEKYYQWSLGDGTSFSGEGTSHTYMKSNDYEVSLRVMNKYGCFQSSYQRYTVDENFNLLAPNSFSPNGDDKNEEWMPQALTTGYYDFELVVFNRNNKQVFVTSDPEIKFNGIVNGNVAASGEMFLWKAYVVDPNGVRQQYGGTIIAIY